MTLGGVELRPETEAALKELAAATGQPIAELVHRAVVDLRRKEFLEGLAADFGALRERPAEWAEELEEREVWDCTLADGEGRAG